MPERVQRQRTKGWRKPPGAISVTRPGRWGNPFTGMVMAVENYREALLEGSLGPDVTVKTVRAELAGHDLMCWCPIGQPCHADVLLEIANA